MLPTHVTTQVLLVDKSFLTYVALESLQLCMAQLMAVQISNVREIGIAPIKIADEGLLARVRTHMVKELAEVKAHVAAPFL